VSELVILAAIAAVPPTITSIAGLIVAYVNLRKSRQIQLAVNGDVTRLKADLVRALARVESLDAQMREARGRRGRPS
jgi:hypothetical protein